MAINKHQTTAIRVYLLNGMGIYKIFEIVHPPMPTLMKIKKQLIKENNLKNELPI